MCTGVCALSDAVRQNIETLTGRAGYALTPALLAYVRGGAAWTNASGAAIISGGPVGEPANFVTTGYSVGGGLEWMFALDGRISFH
jgi:outer membrane immunogenic protein